MFSPTAADADFYWNPASTSNNNWNQTSYWKPAADGSGASPETLSPSLVYSTNGTILATASGTTSFGGGTLLLDGGQLSVKATGDYAAGVAFLRSEGGLIVAAQSSNISHNLQATAFHAASGTTLLSAAADSNGRTLALTIGTLTGAAALQAAPTTGDNRILRLHITDASAYTGDFGFTRGVIDFDNDLSSGGSLTLGGSVKVTLRKNLRFAAVTINGVPLSVGTHSFSTLVATHAAFFNTGGSGGITVGAPVPPDPDTPDPVPPEPIDPPAHAGLGVRPGLRTLQDNVVDPTGLVFATGSFGTSMNGQTFQQEAVVSHNGYQYAAYWHASKRPAVARRALPDGAWETIVFNDYGPISHTDVHNVNVVGVCPSDGTIHLAFDHHNNPLRYRRSQPGVATDPAAHAWTQGLFGSTTSVLVPADGAIGGVSYPQFFPTPDGRLQLAHRNGISGNGDWFLHEYTPAGWVRLGMLFHRGGVFSDKTARSAYPNQFRYDAHGRLHITWSWREAGSTLHGNHDLGYASSDDLGRTWKNNAGAVIAALDGSVSSANAISITSPGHIAYPIQYNWGYMNTTTQFLDSRQRVHVVAWRNPDDAPARTLDQNKWRYHHYWRDTDGVWHEQRLPFYGRKPQTVLADNGDMHVIYGAGANLNYDGTDPGWNLMIATATEASGWTDWLVQPLFGSRRFDGEPLLDMGRWAREKILSVYLQEHPASPGAAPPLRVADIVPVPAQVFAGDLPFVTTPESSGPAWPDQRQNGGPLLLDGVAYPKGLGVRAPSEILVPLDGLHTRFLADIGLDDSTGDAGSVVFQVWADGVKLFDSGLLIGASTGRTVDVDVTGRTTLRLVVTDGGDGTASDLANWAGARLVATPRFTWNDAQFGDSAHDSAIAGPLADPDRDGLANLLEYALGSDPLTQSVGALPSVGTISIGNTPHLTLAIDKNPAAADVAFTAESSTDLVNWSAANLTTLSDSPSRLIVQDTEPLGPNPRYLRLNLGAGVTTVPVGGMRHTFASATLGFAGQPFARPAVWRGEASTSDGATLSADAPGWTAEQFVSAPHYIELLDGPWTGLTADIVANTAETLTLGDDLAGYSPAAFCIRPHATLAGIFGAANEAGLQGGTSIATADEIRWFDPFTQTNQAFYYKNSGLGGAGWRSVGGGSQDRAKAFLYPEQALAISRLSTTAFHLTVTGEARLTRLVFPVEPGFNWLAITQPRPVTLAQSGLYTGDSATGIQGGTSIATADEIRRWTGSGWESFYYKNSGLGGTGWRSVGGGSQDRSDQLLATGSVFMIRRKSDRPFLHISAAYSQ